ncbi:hypothetical protein KEM54_002050 [Ascosphaera aggregata]|nr:hypothetical protein KEM54_002050 [Ascosphaera aggregata]
MASKLLNIATNSLLGLAATALASDVSLHHHYHSHHSFPHVLNRRSPDVAGGNSPSSLPSTSSTSSNKSSSSSSPSWDKTSIDPALEDRRFAHLSILVGGLILSLFLLLRVALRLNDHIRQLFTIGSDTQRFFIRPNLKFAWFKKNVMYAPIMKRRHNQEIRLSSAINVGTLPTRFQLLLLIGIIVMNVVLCVVTIPNSGPKASVPSLVINRSGTMALVNLMPLIIMAGRNNPLITILDIPFDTWNLLHRWFGRIVVLETLVHVGAWFFNKVNTSGWDAVSISLKREFILTGFIGALGFVMIAIQACSPLRHAFYETFLHLHIALAAVTFGMLWVHLNGFHQQRYLLAAIVFWAFDRACRFMWILYRNIGSRTTSAVVEVLPGESLRITFQMVRPWKFRPGQHAYLYIPSVGIWTSHPFTMAWAETQEVATGGKKKLVSSNKDFRAVTTMSMVIRRRTGFTSTLYRKAEKCPDGVFKCTALLEGPYGAEHSLDSYGTVLLFAAGIGITHHTSYMQHLIRGYSNGTVAARRVTLVWIIQSPEHLEWIRPWMTSILNMRDRREVLRVLVFVTRPRNPREISSASATVQVFPGKPNLQTIIDDEIIRQIGAMGVMVCGTGSLADDIRRVCRNRQEMSNIDFIEEAFSW